MYNYRQHDISEATAKRLEEAEKFIDTRLTMAKLAINDGDFQDADLCFEEAYSRWDEDIFLEISLYRFKVIKIRSL